MSNTGLVIKVDNKVIDAYLYMLYEVAENKKFKFDSSSLNKKEFKQIIIGKYSKKDEKKVGKPKDDSGKAKKVAFTISNELKLFLSGFTNLTKKSLSNIEKEFAEMKETALSPDSIKDITDDIYGSQEIDEKVLSALNIFQHLADRHIYCVKHVKKGLNKEAAAIYFYDKLSEKQNKKIISIMDMLLEQLEKEKKEKEEKKKNSTKDSKKEIIEIPDESEDEEEDKKKDSKKSGKSSKSGKSTKTDVDSEEDT